MPKSQLNGVELTLTRWVVSVVNTGSILAGHSAIVIEGLKQREEGRLSGGSELFYGFYDIRAAVWPDEQKKSSVTQTGYVYKVTVKQDNKYPEGVDMSRYYAKSWEVAPARANKVIAAILADRDKILAIDDGYGEGGHPDKSRYPAWSLLGMNDVFGDRGKGMNCTNYCAAWLYAAEIGNGGGKKPSSLTCSIQ
jgi:hypothetical protein